MELDPQEPGAVARNLYHSMSSSCRSGSCDTLAKSGCPTICSRSTSVLVDPRDRLPAENPSLVNVFGAVRLRRHGTVEDAPHARGPAMIDGRLRNLATDETRTE
jgi:hypothetical protein